MLRILVFLTALVLVVSACGGGSATPDTETEGASASEGQSEAADPDEGAGVGESEAEGAGEAEVAPAEEADSGEVEAEETDAAAASTTEPEASSGAEDQPTDSTASTEAGTQAPAADAEGDAAEQESDAGGADADNTATEVAVAESEAAGDEYGPSEPQNIYNDLGIWMCHPDKAAADDVCRAADKSATLLGADGSATVEPFADADSSIDCLYYYPTTSEDATLNSDLIAGTEIGTTVSQTSRLGEVCDVHAPLYRSTTLPALLGGVEGDRAMAREIAFGDVSAAWDHYLQNSDPDRGVVLIGHSQGAGLIRQLIQEQIDADPAMRERLVAAYILGSTVTVPDGELVGGDFENVPVCTTAEETGCVISFSSYVDTDPPGADGIFARAVGDRQAVCVSPAALLGEEADSVFDSELALRETDPKPDVSTTWARIPTLLDTRCVEEGDHNYLELSLRDDSPIAPFNLAFLPRWGAHIHDVHVEYANIARLIERQATAFTAN